MKKHSSRKCSKGKTGFRTPSVFKICADKRNRLGKANNKKRK